MIPKNSFLIFILVTIFFSCIVNKITLDKSEIKLKVGDSVLITANVEPESVRGKDIIWGSDDDSIVTVENGNIFAKRVGVTEIFATVDKVMAKCKVEVLDNFISVDSVRITNKIENIFRGDVLDLSVVVSPENATSKLYSWKIEPSGIVSVIDNRLLALDIGTATVTVISDDEGKTDFFNVTVNPILVPVSSIVIQNKFTNISVEDSVELQIAILPLNATLKTYSWKVEPEGVVSIAGNMLTALAPGVVRVSVTSADGNKTDFFNLTVKVTAPNFIENDGVVFTKVVAENFDNLPIIGVIEGAQNRVENGLFQVETNSSIDQKFTLTNSQPYNLIRVRYKANSSYKPFLIANVNGADIVYLRETNPFTCRIFDAATWSISSSLLNINYSLADKMEWINFDIIRLGQNDVRIYCNGSATNLTFNNFDGGTFSANPLFKFANEGGGSLGTYSLVEYIGLYYADSFVVNVDNTKIIPEPQSLSMGVGSFKINSLTKLNNISGVDLGSAIDLFKNQLLASANINLTDGGGSSNIIEFIRDDTKGDEGYGLRVRSNKIVIGAKNYAGFFYGLQTILQLLPPEVYSKTNKTFLAEIPSLIIEDSPRFSYRGLMVDVSRHYFSLPVLKQIIDEISKVKINKFHWHLTDDGGFRFPFEGSVTVGSKIYDLSKINKKTSYRTGADLNSANYFGNWTFFDKDDVSDPNYQYRANMHGGTYTKAEILELINYAKIRNIQIIPEFDVPGHSTPLFHLFEDLRCDKLGGGNPGKPDIGVRTDICSATDAVIPILDEMFRQITEIFIGDTIHVGADEVKINNNSWYSPGPWWYCSRCEAKIREILSDPTATVNYTNLQKLQAWFLKKVEVAIENRGKKVAIWSEGMRGNFNPSSNTIFYYWNHPDTITSAKNCNVKLINSDTWKYYLDYYQHKSDRDAKNPDAQDWGGSAPTITLQNVYDNNPIQEYTGVNFGSGQIGIQVNMWCEKIIGFTKNSEVWTRDDHLIYMIFPRVVAAAERGWSPEGKKNWTRFNTKMQTQFSRFDNAGMLKYAKHYKQ